MEAQLQTFLLSLSENQFLLAFLLLLATFILEDVANTSAALLASSGHISLSLAFSAILIGIILGDIGLYYLGRFANKSERLKKLLDLKAAQKIEKSIKNRLVFSIILARFIPGARFVAYSAMGFFRANLKTFLLTVFFAVGAWTSFLFFVIYSAGKAFESSNYKIAALIILFIIGIMLPKIIGKIANAYNK